MRINLKFYLLILVFSSIVSCFKDYEVPKDIIVHDFVWKGLNAYYLYQDQIEDLSDRRFNSDEEINTFLRSFPDYNTLFSSLLLSTDNTSLLLEDYNTFTASEIRTSFTNGLEFGLIADPNSTENVIGYVTHILSNSNASSQNIERGDFFNAVDGVLLTKTNYESILLTGSNDFTLSMVNFDGNIATPNGKTVSLQKEAYTYPATFLEKTIPLNGEDIGYLIYNNDFSKNYLENLNNTALNFKNQGIKKLILDLRYNIGSGAFASNIEKLGSILLGQFSDEVFIKEQWNTKAQTWFLANQPDSLVNRFSNLLNQNTAINHLELTDIYIILNGNSFTGSSATELLINSLDAYMNVHVIGNQTDGNNTGSITLYDSEDYDFGLKDESHTVALQPLVLSFLNNNDQTYENGFSPRIQLCNNEAPLNLGVLGENSDPILNSVLNYITNGNTTFPACNQNNFEFIFNSINQQRTIDRGVFIKQDLPNTY